MAITMQALSSCDYHEGDDEPDYGKIPEVVAEKGVSVYKAWTVEGFAIEAISGMVRPGVSEYIIYNSPVDQTQYVGYRFNNVSVVNAYCRENGYKTRIQPGIFYVDPSNRASISDVDYDNVTVGDRNYHTTGTIMLNYGNQPFEVAFRDCEKERITLNLGDDDDGNPLWVEFSYIKNVSILWAPTALMEWFISVDTQQDDNDNNNETA